MDNNSSTLGLALTALTFLAAGIWSLVRAEEIQRSEIAHHQRAPENWIDRLQRSWAPHSDWVKSPQFLLHVRIAGAVSIVAGAALLLLLIIKLSG